MVKDYKTIYKGGNGEIVEKKSRFIATIAHIESEEEAIAFIDQIRKKYWDARHNCSAYIIGERQEIMRCSDDGEPAQTAGKPMLDVLSGRGICNVVAVVTRYFGGTLLGTGGLVRAYSKAVQEGLANSVIVEKHLADEMVITTDYNGIGKIQYLLAQEELTPTDTQYTDIVTVTVPIPVDQTAQLKAKITQGTNGRAKMEVERQLYYGIIGKEVVLFQ